MKRGGLVCALLLLGCGTVSAQAESICYVLDGILFVYGIVLTVLYCRLKMSGSSANNVECKQKPEEGLYAGLTPHAQDTYDIIKTNKK